MGTVIFLAIFVSSIVAAPPQRNEDSDVDKFATVIPESKTSLKTDLIKRTLKKHLTVIMGFRLLHYNFIRKYKFNLFKINNSNNYFGFNYFSDKNDSERFMQKT